MKYALSVLLMLFVLSGVVMLVHPLSAQESDSPSLEDTLFVTSLILTTGIEDHEPIDTVQAFSATVDSQAFCHIRIHNTTDPVNIRFRWTNNDTVYSVFNTTVGISSSWRTFSAVDPQPGKWRVQILGPNGQVLKQKRFSILKDR